MALRWAEFRNVKFHLCPCSVFARRCVGCFVTIANHDLPFSLLVWGVWWGVGPSEPDAFGSEVSPLSCGAGLAEQDTGVPNCDQTGRLG